MGLALEQFDNEAPQPIIGGGSELAKVKDGPISFRIDTTEHRGVSRSEQGGAKLHGEAIKLNFTVLGGDQDGLECSHEWWIINRQDADRFSGDLQLMGFDPENWSPKNNRPFSKEVEKAMKLFPGLILDAEKSSSDSTKTAGKKIHFLNIKGRKLDKPADKGGKPVDGKPEKFTAEQLTKAVEDAFA